MGGASKLLGVKGVTVRQWANQGVLYTFRTPGGHRRFAREELLRLVQEQGSRVAPADLVEQAVQKLRRSFRKPRPVQGDLQSPDEDSRGRLRVLGRRLVEVAMRYHSDKRRRSALLEEARFLGTEYANETLKLGLGLGPALESFFFHRSRLLETVQNIASVSLSREQALGLLRDMTELTDAVLRALGARYELSWQKSTSAQRSNSGQGWERTTT